VKIYCFDIDGTLCSKGHEDYNFSQPYRDRISKVNQLYDDGNTILLFTARGSYTGIDWKDLTEKQLKDWGLKYHKLILGKPHADIFIDDRAQDPFGWFK
tara:strand:+ start:5583 stop:5879 length:297 start_codon:yes stop_codon:yes gene_type:complete